jgi:hypothetical protein
LQDTVDLRAWGLAWLLLAATLLFPFFLVDMPPVLDYPNHLAGFYVLAHGDDPVLSRFYAPHWTLLPNLGTYPLATALMQVFPVHVAGRLILGGVLLAPVAGAVVYSRAAFGRFTYWSLASGLAAYNGLFFLGFLNFLLGIGIALAGAGVWIAARRRGLAQACLVGAAASTLAFFCHLTSALLLAILLSAYEAEGLHIRRPGWLRRGMSSALVLAASFTPAAVLYLFCPVAENTAPALARPWRDKLVGLLTPFLTYQLVLAVAAAGTVLLILYLCKARVARGGWVALAVLALLYVFAPASTKGVGFVDMRIPVMAGFVMFATTLPRPAPRFAAVTVAAVCALLAARSLGVAKVWSDHRRDLAAFRELIAPITPGARLLSAISYGRPGNIVVPGVPASLNVPGLYYVNLHMPALAVIERHAYWPLLFADPGQQPLSTRPPYDRLAYPAAQICDALWLVPDHPSDKALAAAPYLRNWRRDFDYVLLMSADAPERLAPPPPGLKLLSRNRTGALYAIAR